VPPNGRVNVAVGSERGRERPPLRARCLTHSPNLKGSLTPPLECPTVPYEVGSVFLRRQSLKMPEGQHFNASSQ
jgi:hypothetical protein